jgi:hypothetical protein
MPAAVPRVAVPLASCGAIAWFSNCMRKHSSHAPRFVIFSSAYRLMGCIVLGTDPPNRVVSGDLDSQKKPLDAECSKGSAAHGATGEKPAAKGRAYPPWKPAPQASSRAVPARRRDPTPYAAASRGGHAKDLLSSLVKTNLLESLCRAGAKPGCVFFAAKRALFVGTRRRLPWARDSSVNRSSMRGHGKRRLGDWLRVVAPGCFGRACPQSFVPRPGPL